MNLNKETEKKFWEIAKKVVNEDDWFDFCLVAIFDIRRLETRFPDYYAEIKKKWKNGQ